MTIIISSDISEKDIPFLMQNDYSIYSKKIAPIISSTDYKQWLQTEEVHAVVARDNKEIIGQMWAHPIKLYQNNELTDSQFFWIHNIKIHPAWQNKGIYKEMADYYNEKLFSKDIQPLYLVNSTNTRMRHLAGKSKVFPVLNVFGVILFRYIFFPRTKKITSLKLLKSHNPPESWVDFVLKSNKYWIPRFSWDNLPKWFSFYFKNQLVCVLQVTQPIHPVQGRLINKFAITLQTAQIRYFLLSNNFLKSRPQIIRSILATLFRLYPQVNAFICTLNPAELSKLLHLPRFLIPTQNFILYSTTKNPELISNNLDFQEKANVLNFDNK